MGDSHRYQTNDELPTVNNPIEATTQKNFLKHVILLFCAAGILLLASIQTQSTKRSTHPWTFFFEEEHKLDIDEERNQAIGLVTGFSGHMERKFELLSLKSDEEKNQLWHEFKKLYGKEYRSMEEEKEKFGVFLANLQTIDTYNTRNKGALHGITKFSDMTRDEFKSMNTLQLQTFKQDVNNFIEKAENFVKSVVLGESHISAPDLDDCPACSRFPELKDFLSEGKLPEKFDWRTYEAVTPVKNQGLCGNCWAWAAAADIEASWYLAGNDLVTVSAQQMSSCAPDSLCCVGGVMATGFDYVIENGGIATEDDYPFVDGMGKCSECLTVLSVGDNQKVHISKWSSLTSLDDELKRDLIRFGPISIGINAQPMQFYQGGIDAPDDCDPQGLDHGVVLVGYGSAEADSEGYWIIKNSWGPDWGEQGYYHISEALGACGVGELSMKSFV